MAANQLSDTSLISDANLQFYMKFEDDWTDETANAYDLTASGTPTFVTGVFGKAGNFVAASSQKATRAIASMANVAITTTQGWMFWIKVPTLVANNYTFGISNGGHWFCYNNAAGNQVLAANLSSDLSAGTLSAGVWAHVALTYNSSTNKISSWFNGVIVQNQVTVTGTWTKSGNTFGLGNIGDFGGYGTFVIDDLAMFNREITQTDIDLINPAGTTTSTSTSTTSSSTSTTTTSSSTSTTSSSSSTSTTSSSTSTTSSSSSTSTTSSSTSTTTTSSSTSTTSSSTSTTSSSTSTTSSSSSTSTTSSSSSTSTTSSSTSTTSSSTSTTTTSSSTSTTTTSSSSSTSTTSSSSSSSTSTTSSSTSTTTTSISTSTTTTSSSSSSSTSTTSSSSTSTTSISTSSTSSSSSTSTTQTIPLEFDIFEEPRVFNAEKEE